MVTATAEADIASVDMNAVVKCETTRADCQAEATWYAITTCCNEQSPLCEPHAKQGMAEWDSPFVVLGLTPFFCGYCNVRPMPRPTWRLI